MRAPGEKAASKASVEPSKWILLGESGSGPPVTPSATRASCSQRTSFSRNGAAPLGSSLSEKMERDGLSTADQKLIRESWQKVGTSPLEHGTVLFTRLFDLEPDLLPLFKYNCKKFSTPQECLSSPEFLEHIRKVMLVIDAAVTHLENLHCLEDYLANLGRKHQAVGVKVESFEAVGDSLLYMLEKCHGPAFKLNVREAWTKLYSTVVKAMSCGWDVHRKME